MNTKAAMALFAASLSLTLVACGKETASASASASASDIMEGEVKSAILEVLKDPSSAQFKDFKCKKSDDPKYFSCYVKVNSKNSMGGYVGFQEFFYDSRTGKIIN